MLFGPQEYPKVTFERAYWASGILSPPHVDPNPATRPPPGRWRSAGRHRMLGCLQMQRSYRKHSVLNTFAWVARSNPRRCSAASEFLILYRQCLRWVMLQVGVGLGSGVCAERSVSRSHLFCQPSPHISRLCLHQGLRGDLSCPMASGLWHAEEKWVEGGGVERMEPTGAWQGWVVSGAPLWWKMGARTAHVQLWSREQMVKEKPLWPLSGPCT